MKHTIVSIILKIKILLCSITITILSASRLLIDSTILEAKTCSKHAVEWFHSKGLILDNLHFFHYTHIIIII